MGKSDRRYNAPHGFKIPSLKTTNECQEPLAASKPMSVTANSTQDAPDSPLNHDVDVLWIKLDAEADSLCMLCSRWCGAASRNGSYTSSPRRRISVTANVSSGISG